MRNVPLSEDPGLEVSRIVRLCLRITGDRDAAEDLAQETMLEALRSCHRLRNAEAQSQWITGIARNVCMRWWRGQARERQHHIQLDGGGERGMETLKERVADDFDLEAELERRELVELLDRAMGLLRPSTREVLTRRYVDDQAYSAIAEGMGLSEAAVWMRINRGKLVLGRVLRTDLRDEAIAYGLMEPDDSLWQPTRIWCPVCGQCRLHGRFDHDKPAFTLRCAECYRRWAGDIARTEWAECLNAVKGYRAAMTRLNRMSAQYFRQALTGRVAPCQGCSRPALVRVGRPSVVPAAMRSIPGAYVECEACGSVSETTLDALVAALPVGRYFRREHPRMRILPTSEVEHAGAPAFVTRFEAITDSARLEVVSAQDTFEVLAISQSPSTPVLI